jgi:hypothetical protein
LAERSQIPRKKVPLVVIQVVNRDDVRRAAILDSTKFATPARSPPHLDILPQRGGYSVRRSVAAPFTGSTPETATVHEFLSTAADAWFIRIHGTWSGC